MKEKLKELIKSFHNKIINFKPREINIPFDTGKIITLIGARRVGKTHIFYQLIQELVEKNIPKKNILYINFEDERFEYKKENLKYIIEAYLELYPDLELEKCYFFFDEIQNVEDWEKFIRRIHENYTKNIFITGSSAKLLSTEIATALRGRSISYKIYPLSFREYLSFKEVKIDIYDEKKKAKIKNEFEKYIKIGSYPEILNLDEDLVFKTYQEYLSVMILKDIIERYNLKNKQILNIFIKKSVSNISSEFSLNKLYNELKSQGLNVSKDFIYELPNYLEDIFLLYFLEKYETSLVKRNFAVKKSFVNDIGFINIFKFNEEVGKILENIVFIQLKRKELEIYFHKEKTECDFIVKKQNKIINAIQVTKSIENEETKNREIKGLIDAMKKYNLSEGYILTKDEEKNLISGKFTIKIIPIWKWLLE
jgi:hypothetical protein